MHTTWSVQHAYRAPSQRARPPHLDRPVADGCAVRCALCRVAWHGMCMSSPEADTPPDDCRTHRAPRPKRAHTCRTAMRRRRHRAETPAEAGERRRAGGHRPRRAHPWSYRTAHTHARPRSPSTSSAPTLPALQAMRATRHTCTEYGPSVDAPLGHYPARTPHNARHRRPVTHTQAQAVPSTLFNCREKRSVSTLARCHAKRRTLLQARP